MKSYHNQVYKFKEGGKLFYKPFAIIIFNKSERKREINKRNQQFLTKLAHISMGSRTSLNINP